MFIFTTYNSLFFQKTVWHKIPRFTLEIYIFFSIHWGGVKYHIYILTIRLW